jgi:hypothetical protein
LGLFLAEPAIRCNFARFRWDVIENNYDLMMKYATAIRLRTASTEALLRRFTSKTTHPAHAAMLEAGRAQRSIFLARWLRDRDLQRETESGLNVVENYNGVNDYIRFGKRGELASNRHEEQELGMLCLHILQSSLGLISGEHVQVGDLGWVRDVAGRHDELDQQQPRAAAAGRDDVGQDLPDLLLGPVVQDERGQVGIASGRDRLQEVTCHALSPVTDTVPGQDRGGAGDDMGKVEQHTVHVRVRRQDGGEHSAVGAPDVDDRSGAIQRQGRDRRALEPAGQAGHRGGEPAGLLGVLGQPGEERLAVEGRLGSSSGKTTFSITAR